MFAMMPADPARDPRFSRDPRLARDLRPAPEPAPAPAPPAPALEGDLAIFPATDLFQFFALLGLSGTLELTHDAGRGGERVRLRLRAGRLIEAHTSGPRAYLGELLVRRYGVPVEAVLDGLRCQSAARRQGRPSSRLGQMLLERRQLSEEVLRRALDDSVARIAGPVLLWDSGSFAFLADPSSMVPPALAGREAGPQSAAPEACTPEVSLEELVLRRWNPPGTEEGGGSAPGGGGEPARGGA